MEKKIALELLHQKMVAEIQDYAIILLNLDGTILSWNPGAEKIKGYKAEEIRNNSVPRRSKKVVPGISGAASKREA
jgi:PAS domain S-box-containing protein